MANIPTPPFITASGNFNDLFVNKFKTATPSEGIPGGSNESIQFNSNGTFQGSNDFTWNSTTSTLSASNSTLSGDQLGFFNKSAEQQVLATNSLDAVINCLKAYGLLIFWSQQGAKLVGTGVVGTSVQGRAVSLSSDGNTLAVAGEGDNSGIGATWIFTRTSGVWSQQGTKLIGTGAVGNANQGKSVSLSSDGNTLAVGGSFDNGLIGATWIFTRTAGVWTQEGAKLVGTGVIGTSLQGISVSLSSDGNTLAVGGSNDNGLLGATWIFTRSAGVWTQQGSKLVGTGPIGNSAQGVSVSLSDDGNTLAVGGSRDDNFVGATWIFTRSAGVWTQQGTKLIGTGAVGNASQGFSVSISDDGNTLAVGGSGDNGSIGATWIFIRTLGSWSQQGSKLVGTGNQGNSLQGNSVSLSSDILAVGGKFDNGAIGATWLFTRKAGIWTQLGTKLVGTGNQGASQQGDSVCLSSDGKTLAVGGELDNGNIGATWIFVD
jgi:hypothetical protein